RNHSDAVLFTALGLAAVAAFAGQFVFGTQPSFFLPVGICALPFAASARRRMTYRAGATLLLAAFIAFLGIDSGILFVPSLVALAVSTYRARPRPGGRSGRHR